MVLLFLGGGVKLTTLLGSLNLSYKIAFGSPLHRVFMGRVGQVLVQLLAIFAMFAFLATLMTP